MTTAGRSPRLFSRVCVDKDKALYGSIQKEARVLLDEIGFATVTRGEVEIAFFDKVLFDTAEDLHGVAVAEFGDEHPDRKGLALAQGACEEAGSVVEFGGSLNHPVARVLRDGADSGSIVEHKRNRGRRKVEVLTEGAQTDGLAGLWRRSWFRLLGHALLF